MRLKDRPEDFVVYEVADIHPEGQGPYALYRLCKRDLTTWDVLGEIARRLRLRQDQLGYGGLKDRRSLSYQFVTIPQGPKRDLRGSGWQLEYLGQVASPMSKARLKGNLFEITVRDLEVGEEDLEKEVRQVQQYGLPNYFDEQRFGSVRHQKEFVARKVVLGEYEEALYLLLVESSQYESRKTQAFRDCLRRHWPQLKPCQSLAPSPWEKKVVEFLVSHGRSKRTFKRALALVDREYLLMLAHAYQAYLWNEILKEFLIQRGWDHIRIPYLLGELVFYETLPPEGREEFRKLRLPLPAPRLHLSSPWEGLVEEVLAREGLSGLSQLRSAVKGLVFKSYPRETGLFPTQMSWGLAPDERYPGRKKAFFRFFLPKGAYATLVLKRLFRRAIPGPAS